MKTTIYLFAAILLITSCSVSTESSVSSQKVEDYVKPIATFLNGTSGAQLFSYFSQPDVKKEKVTLNGNSCSTGSYGKDPAIFLCNFTVDGVAFEPFVTVSKEDMEKVKDALKKAEQEQKKDDVPVNITFEATISAEGSNKSPFGGEIKVEFTDGKIISIN